MTLLKMAVDNWYNEITNYNFNKPGFSEATGHFTCLVWLSSITFGMGISINPTTSATIIVFNTSPPGNVIGQFQQNVLPVIGAIPVPSLPPVVPVNSPAAPPTPKQQIINLLNNLIHQLKTYQKPSVTIPTLNSVLQIFQTIPNTNETIMDQLFYIYYLLQIHHNPKEILKNVNNVLNSIKNL
jgi:hypothetical protein